MFQPEFRINNKILKYISEVEACKEVITNSPLLPLYERQFKTDAVARKVHFSTAIEGNYLNINEVRKIVDGNIGDFKQNGEQVISRKRDLYEVINYRDLVKYIESLTKKHKKEHSYYNFDLTEPIIKEMHRMLLKNIYEPAGQYRVGTAISVNYLTGEKLYPYEDVGNVETRLRELIYWYNNSRVEDVNPIIKAGILHLEFVRIHPFEEGNGRLARALATLSLSVDNYDVEHFFCLDEYYDSNAEEYYHHLGVGFLNLTTWLEYFCLGMAIEFKRVKERVLKISKDATIKTKVGQLYISERQEKIIEWLNHFGFIRNQDFNAIFPDISDDTVLRELKILVDNGVLTKKGRTKSARYEFAD